LIERQSVTDFDTVFRKQFLIEPDLVAAMGAHMHGIIVTIFANEIENRGRDFVDPSFALIKVGDVFDEARIDIGVEEGSASITLPTVRRVATCKASLQNRQRIGATAAGDSRVDDFSSWKFLSVGRG